MVRKPALANSWSSAITTRAIPDFCIGSAFLPISYTSFIERHNWNLRDQQSTSARLTRNKKMPPDQLYSFLHSTNTHVFTGVVLLEQDVWLKTAAPILHLKTNFRISPPKRQAYSRRLRVFAHIGERFLGYTEERGFNGRGQAFRSEHFLKKNRPSICPQRLDL